MAEKEELIVQWRCHLPNLIKETLVNHGASALKIPMQITMDILHELAELALEIDDPRLHKLMCRLTLYAQADPESPDYDPEMVKSLDCKII